MIKVELGEVWGWHHALRGMRNPMNSWDRADSDIERGFIGKNDADLMRRLYNGGAVHRKYLRQVFISADITAPLYWWKVYDTYKVGTTANSCSTMHKIAAKPFELDDFSHEHLLNDPVYHVFSPDKDIEKEVIWYDDEYPNSALDVLDFVIKALNQFRELYLETKDKRYWWQMIQLLPSSYNQKRTVTFSYENAVTMIVQRTGHKLDEWNEFVEMLKTLPFMDILLNQDQKEGEPG